MPRYRICYQKTGPAAFLSHLDLVRVMERSARRAGLPLAYSGGFNPHPKMVFAAPLPVGVSGEEELADIELREEKASGTVAADLNRCLPEGLAVRQVRRMEEGGPLMAAVHKAEYRLTGSLDGPLSPEGLARVIENLLARKSIFTSRLVKGKTRTRDIRPGIDSLTGEVRDGRVDVFLTAAIGVRPRDVLDALVDAGLPADPDGFAPVRLSLVGDGPLFPPESLSAFFERKDNTYGKGNRRERG